MVKFAKSFAMYAVFVSLLSPARSSDISRWLKSSALISFSTENIDELGSDLLDVELVSDNFDISLLSLLRSNVSMFSFNIINDCRSIRNSR